MKNAFKLSSLALALTALPAAAQEKLEIVGVPTPGGIGFQPAATSEAEAIHSLDHLILVIITLICIFVVGLLIYAILRFNSRSNPTPSKFTHNTPLEVAWTIVPVFILVLIGAFSLPVLFNQQEIPEGEVVIKATGYQWYWGYEYVDEGFGFDAYMIGQPATGGNYVLNDEVEAMLQEAGYSRDEFLLATDNAMVVPVGTTTAVSVASVKCSSEKPISASWAETSGVSSFPASAPIM